MEQYVNDLLPFHDDNKQNVIHEINMSVRSNAIGIPLRAVIQGGVAMIGYWIFGAPNILFADSLNPVAYQCHVDSYRKPYQRCSYHWDDAGAVSYTHLDVYKRQIIL